MSRREGVLLLSIVAVALTTSALSAKDLGTGVLEWSGYCSSPPQSTYAETPIGNWVQDLFVTATLTTAVCRSISVGFELVERAAPWPSAPARTPSSACRVTSGTPGGTPFLCLCGAVLAQLLLRRVHDDQLP